MESCKVKYYLLFEVLLEFHYLIQGCKSSKWLSWDLKPPILIPEFLMTAVCCAIKKTVPKVSTSALSL